MIRNGRVVSHPWLRYSKKLQKRIVAPMYVGVFTPEMAAEKKLRLATSREGSLSEGNCLTLYWLVDPEDGVIVDACFQAFGESPLIAAADVACELVMRKTYQQARRLSADHLDSHLRDKTATLAFPQEAYYHLNLVLFAMDETADQCMDIPMSEEMPQTPLGLSSLEPHEYPNWGKLDHEGRLALIEGVLDEHIRPFIALDDGGVQVVDLKNDTELTIAYSGNCTGCFASTGSTLSSIQQILQARVHPEMTVIPDLSHAENYQL